jgi:hypothetical protein
MMIDQKIDKQRRDVLFTLADGSEVAGEVFLRLYEAHRPGPQRVGELLNGEDRFIPVATADGMVHLNVLNVVTARTSAVAEWDDLEGLGRKYAVRVTTRLGEITGEMFVNMPEENCRVSDYLSRPNRFFQVLVPDYVLYVGARFILFLRD